MKRTAFRLRLCVALLCVNLLFIWGNSLMPGELSGMISRWVQTLFGLEESGHTGHGLLRKLAHFTEFACLGAGFAWLHAMLGRKQWRSFGLGFLAACIDETIQCFVPDRGPAVADVLLDTAGVAAGMGLLFLCYTIHKKKYLNTIGGN